MKKTKGNVIIIITILIILILIGIVILVYFNIKDTNANINVNNEQKQNVEVTNDLIKNETGNDTILAPNFNNIIDDENSTNMEKNEIASVSFYYNQLNSNAKKIYSKLKQEKNNLKTGTYVINFGTEFNTLLHSENGQQTLKEDFQAAIDAFFYDDCSLFYVDTNKLNLINESHSLEGTTTYYISIGPANGENYLQENFQTAKAIETAEIYIDNIIKQMLEQTKKDTEETKIKKVHNWLVRVVDYDINGNNRYNIYGAIHDKKAVCEGYARSFKYIMEKMNIPTILVSGNAKNSEGRTQKHAWNYVQINDIWYAIDITWDDPIIEGTGVLKDQEKYKYFLKGANEFFKDHTEGGNISENGKIFTFPLISGNDYK